MTEKIIAKKVSAQKLKKARGGSLIVRVTTALTVAGPGRGHRHHGGKFPRDDDDGSTGDA